MIYFIRCNDLIKIGVAENPWSRLTDLQIGNPARLELMAVAPGEYEKEGDYHRQISYCRQQGEWFRYDELIGATIDAVKSQYPKLQVRPLNSLYINGKTSKRSRKKKLNISPADAVRLLVNTAVLMMENEPGIDVRSVTESKRGPGILIWIPGYIDNDGTIIVAQVEEVLQEEPTP
jgi:hypothetical protein